ncbi:hypothetical protein BJ912DRAFT_988790 [Pholiota molesta]|nr:hypothetical protein BJ912DRAFT_988790 [Pholiota molesta]
MIRHRQLLSFVLLPIRVTDGLSIPDWPGPYSPTYQRRSGIASAHQGYDGAALFRLLLFLPLPSSAFSWDVQQNWPPRADWFG